MSLVPQCFQTIQPTKQELYAVQALEKGEATPFHQRLALQFILTKLCRVYDVHFVPGEPDVSNFLEGRGFVGQEIFKILNINPSAIREMKDD